MEVVKTKGTRLLGRVVFVLSVIFLMVACQFASGQELNRVVFSQDGKDFVKKYNNESMKLKSPLIGDDIILNVYSDSIDKKTITFAVYIYFPENINPSNNSIVIEYTDGTSDVLQQTIFNKLKGEIYAEYEPIIGLDNIFSKKVSSLTIRGVAKYNNIDKLYFKDFFARL